MNTLETATYYKLYYILLSVHRRIAHHIKMNFLLAQLVSQQSALYIYRFTHISLYEMVFVLFFSFCYVMFSFIHFALYVSSSV